MNPPQHEKALSYTVLGTSPAATDYVAPNETFESFSTPFKPNESNFAYYMSTPLNQSSSTQQLYGSPSVSFKSWPSFFQVEQRIFSQISNIEDVNYEDSPSDVSIMAQAQLAANQMTPLLINTANQLSHTPNDSTTNQLSHTPSDSTTNQRRHTPSDSTTNQLSHTPSDSTTNQLSHTPSDSTTNQLSHTPTPSDRTTNQLSHAPSDSTTNQLSHTPSDSTTNQLSQTPSDIVASQLSRSCSDTLATMERCQQEIANKRKLNQCDGENHGPNSKRCVPKNYEKNLREITPVHLTLCTTVEARHLSDLYDIMKQFKFAKSLTSIDKTNLFGDLIAYLLEFSIPKCRDRKILSITTHAVLQMIPQIQHNRSSNSSDLLVLQIEDEAGYLDSFRIPHIVGEAILIYFEAVRPYFIKPEGIDQKKVSCSQRIPPYYVMTEPFFVNSWGKTPFKERNVRNWIEQVTNQILFDKNYLTQIDLY